MKPLIIFLIFSSFETGALAQFSRQTPVDTNRKNIVNALNSAREMDRTAILQKKGLVSPYTFKTLIKSDFSTLTGLDNSATVGKYAALDVDQNSSAFTFTPITIIDQDLVHKKFHLIQSVAFTGTVDKNSLFDLKNWRTVTLSYSLTYLFKAGYNFNSKPAVKDYEEIYNQIDKRFKQTYEQTNVDILRRLDHPEYDKKLAPDYEDLKKSYLDTVAKYEKDLTESFWTAKHFAWIKANINALSFDNTNYVVTGDASTYNTPKNKAIYTPSLLVSANYYYGLSNGWNFYGSIFLQGIVKDSFSDVFDASEWDKISPLTDSALVKTDTKNVFVTTDENVKTKLLTNMGINGILLFPSFPYFGFGIDYSFSVNSLISNNTQYATGYLKTSQTGLILSFKDKSGASTINVEPYYQAKNYSQYTLASSHLWGVKLSIPFSRLY